MFCHGGGRWWSGAAIRLPFVACSMSFDGRLSARGMHQSIIRSVTHPDQCPLVLGLQMVLLFESCRAAQLQLSQGQFPLQGLDCALLSLLIRQESLVMEGSYMRTRLVTDIVGNFPFLPSSPSSYRTTGLGNAATASPWAAPRRPPRVTSTSPSLEHLATSRERRRLCRCLRCKHCRRIAKQRQLRLTGTEGRRERGRHRRAV
jgi:hypothetical protein